MARSQINDSVPFMFYGKSLDPERKLLLHEVGLGDNGSLLVVVVSLGNLAPG